MKPFRSSTRGPDLAATVEVCTNPKCERCWRLLPDVGTDAVRTVRCGGGVIF